MPSIVDSSDPAVLDYCQSFKQDPDDQTPIATEPLFPWHEYHQSTTIGQESFAPTETSYPTPQITRFSRAPEAQATSRQAVWSYKTQQEDCFPHQSATNQLYNPFRFNHGFTGSVSAHSSMQRPLLPLPLRQRRTWTDSTVTNTMNQMLISNPQSSPSFPYDAANQMAPGIYSTTSDCHPSFRPDMRPSHMDLGDDMTANSCETDGESKDGSPPYAKLIYQALMAAPGHKLILRDIYAWIAQNTDKAKNPMNKGWQNSVRHNLSMNGSFQKVDLVDPNNQSKKGYIWVLDPSAVGRGIQSTTRYRPKPGKKHGLTDAVDVKRQRAGKRGGKAARKSGRCRSLTTLDDPMFPNYPSTTGNDFPSHYPVDSSNQLSPNLDLNSPSNLPYYCLPTPPLSTRSPFPDNSSHDYGDNTGYFENQPIDFTLNNNFEHGPETGFLSEPECSRFDEGFFGNDLTCLP